VNSTADLLQQTLHTLRRGGWSPCGYGAAPPWCIRRALSQVVADAYRYGSGIPDDQVELAQDNAAALARQQISRVIGAPLGLIASWETDEKRTAADVEAALEKAIASEMLPSRRRFE
jgi:hypothetical protein